MSKASLELGGGNWAAKDGKLLGYAVGDTSGKYVPREFDFTRNSDIAATRVNEDGLIEKHRENLLLHSNQFDTTWILSGASVTSGQTGYDGTSDAWLQQSTSTFCRLDQNITQTGVLTLSAYAKAGTSNFLLLEVTRSGGAFYAYFDLSSGDVGTISAIDANIEKVGNGWYRCTLIGNQTLSGQARLRVADSDGSTVTTTSSNIYIQDAQLEYGLVATDYLESGAATGKAGILDNLPRIDYTGGSASLLLEPQRTNVCTNSEDVSNWSLTFATATPNDTISPEGVQNAAKIVTSNLACDVKLTSIPVSPSTTYTATFYCKLTSGSGLQTRFYDNTNGATIEYYNYSSQLVVGEWKRVTRTFTTPAGCNNIQIWFLAASSSASVTAHYWGYQLEEGSYPTSYIPTYGTSVTRNSDDIDILDTTSLLTQTTSNTIYGEFTNLKEQAGNSRFITLFASNTNNSDRILLYTSYAASSYSLTAQYKTSGEADVQIALGGLSYNEKVKFAAVFNGTQMSLFINGSLVGSSTIVAANNFYYYDPTNVQADLGFKVHQLAFFPTPLTNSECIALTTL